jgi:hypothetical protein
MPILDFFSEKPLDPARYLKGYPIIAEPEHAFPDHPIHPLLKTARSKTPVVGAGGSVLDDFDWLKWIPCDTCKQLMVTLYNGIMDDRNRKMIKGFLGFGCLFKHDNDTCNKSIETYYMIFEFEMWNGVFGDTFFCQSILATCGTQWVKQDLASYVIETIAAQKPPALAEDNFIDSYYEANAALFSTNTAKTNTILQMSNLNVDLQYNAGADSYCRGMRCCHLQGDGKLPDDISESSAAGPYGHSDCDMPSGGVR